MSGEKIGNIYILSMVKKFNTVLFGLLATIFINRLLGPSLKGDYEYINNILTIMIAVLNMGITTVLPNYVRKKNSWTISTFYALSFFQFITYICISIVVWLIIEDINYFLYCCVVAFGILSLQMLNCTMIYNFKVTVIANSISVIVNAIILWIAFALGFSDISIIFIVIIIKESVACILCIIPMAKKLHLSEIRFNEWKGILIAGIIPMMTSVLAIMNYKFDVLELKWLGIKSYNIGLYTVGVNLAEYVLLISDVFKDVLFNKTAKDDNIESMKFCLRICSTIMILAFVFMTIFGKLVIFVLFGKEYITAYFVTIIVIAGAYSMMYFKLLGVLYIAQGNWKFYFNVLLGSVLINAITNLFFIPIMSMYGAALTSVLSYSFAGGVFLIRFKKKYACAIRDIAIVNKNDISRVRKGLRKGLKDLGRIKNE